MRAVQIGNTEVVKLLLERGADVNVKSTTDGSTALMWATQKGNMDIVKLLLKNSADVNAENDDGTTAHHIAIRQGYTNIVQLLEKAGAEKSLSGYADFYETRKLKVAPKNRKQL